MFMAQVEATQRQRDRAEAAEADAADYKQRWQDMMDALLAVDKQRKDAEARIAEIVALLGDAEKRIMPGKSNEAWLEAVEAWRDNQDGAQAVNAEVARLRVDNDAAEGNIKQLTDWIIEADAAYNIDGKPAETLGDCLGLVRMCHEGAAALHKVARLREALAEALDPNTEWTSSTWARLLAVRDGDTFLDNSGQDAL
jgi:hypothetical protein